MSAYRTILFERDGAVATVTMNRPEVLNAYDMAMRDDFFAAFTAVRDDPTIRAIVLRGNGRAFSSGGDLREFGSAPSPVAAREVRWRRDVWGLLRTLPVPTIAAVHGLAAGSGFEMALLCDLRIAARGTVFSLPETALSLIPGVVGTQTAPRVLGLGRALEMVLAGRSIDARQAERIGVVGSVVAPEALRAAARRMAERLTKIDRELSSSVKRLVTRGLDLGIEVGLRAERAASLAGRRGSEGPAR